MFPWTRPQTFGKRRAMSSALLSGCRALLLSVVLAAGIAPRSAMATPTGDAADWINNLRCGEMVQDSGGTQAHEALQHFLLWFMGFQAGVSVVPSPGPAYYSPKTAVSLNLLLNYCMRHRDVLAAEAARHFMSVQYNRLRGEGEIRELLPPLRPVE